MKVCWLSGGVSSFIAAYLAKSELDKVIYIHIENQHPDTLRFVLECIETLQVDSEILMSNYRSVDNIIQQFRFINSRYGAKCTDVLKKRVRKEWEYGKKDLTYIWGYDGSEAHRADSIVATNPQFNHVFPLIDKGLSKEDCHGMLRDLRIKRPAMYDMGYRNNNCIGCVKGGMGYWNKIRVDFPEVFAKRARQEREICHTCIKGIYLDELDPKQGNIQGEIMEDCGFMCMIAESEVLPNAK